MTMSRMIDPLLTWDHGANVCLSFRIFSTMDINQTHHQDINTKTIAITVLLITIYIIYCIWITYTITYY